MEEHSNVDTSFTTVRYRHSIITETAYMYAEKSFLYPNFASPQNFKNLQTKYIPKNKTEAKTL